MFVIYHYPYGRKHPKMYLMQANFTLKEPEENTSLWTFDKKKAKKFKTKEFAYTIMQAVLSKAEQGKGGIEVCSTQLTS